MKDFSHLTNMDLTMMEDTLRDELQRHADIEAEYRRRKELTLSKLLEVRREQTRRAKEAAA